MALKTRRKATLSRVSKMSIGAVFIDILIVIEPEKVDRYFFADLRQYLSIPFLR